MYMHVHMANHMSQHAHILTTLYIQINQVLWIHNKCISKTLSQYYYYNANNHKQNYKNFSTGIIDSACQIACRIDAQT